MIIWQTPKLAQVSKKANIKILLRVCFDFAFILKYTIWKRANKECWNICLKCLLFLWFLSYFLASQTFFVWWFTDKDDIFAALNLIIFHVSGHGKMGEALNTNIKESYMSWLLYVLFSKHYIFHFFTRAGLF